MPIKSNIKSIMDNQNYSAYRLEKDTGLTENTIRSIINKPNYNPTLNTLRLIAEALNCEVDELLKNDSWLPLYNYFLSSNEKYASHIKKPFFSVDCINFIKKYLLSIGIITDIQPTSLSLTSLSIKSKDNSGIALVDIYLRISKTKQIILEVIDFYVYVNLNITNEFLIKKTLISMIEDYAKLNQMNKIIFYNLHDKNVVDSIDLTKESELSTQQFHCDTSIEKKIIKEKDYKHYKPPFMPSDTGIQWIKHLTH